MLPDVVDQAILILPHFEEIVVLTDAFDWPFTVRAEAIFDVFFRPKPLVKCAIPASIVSLIYQLLIENVLKVSLNDGLVRGICCSDEGIVGDIQAFPEILKLRSQFIAMGLRIDSGFGCGLLNFLSMLIEPGEKEDVTSSKSPVASQHVGSYGRIGVANVRHVVHIVDGRCDVETVGVTHVA